MTLLNSARPVSQDAQQRVRIRAPVHGRSRAGRRVQRGSMAVEFAIVFPLFFLVFYAIVTYSMIFVAQQSLTLAASEGARAPLRRVSSTGSRAWHPVPPRMRHAASTPRCNA
ncbi:TadE family protein [Caballeronia udeis]|uniref:TadE family protein n=1 Tax=Caballeronia udeis TaxID=1232866 RepID=A0A158H1J7_9BURK|nr:TadE family protein [Caballeronia udeis]